MFRSNTNHHSNGRLGIGEDHFVVDDITWETLVASVHELSVIIVPEFTPPSEGVALEHLRDLEHHEELIPGPWLKESVGWLGVLCITHCFELFY